MKEKQLNTTLSNDEVLVFIKDCEDFLHEYLTNRGITQQEYPNAYLDLQWKFLHSLMQRPSPNFHRRITRKRELKKSS